MIRSFAYVKPDTMEGALKALQTENSRPLAGGTDLLVDMRNGLLRPDLLVDLKGLEEMKVFSVDPEKGLKIGALSPLNLLIDNKKIRECCPVLTEAAFSVATYQVRNRATLVGNICNASPAADMAPPLFILEAQLIIAGPDGERKVPSLEFMTGVKKNALKRGELVVRVEIPPPLEAKMAFLKKQRVKGHDLALINVAGLADKKAGRLRICVGACAAAPLLLKGTDRLYEDIKDVDRLAENVADLALRTISPIDDVRASKEYRSDMVRVYVKRIVKKICS